MPSKQLITWTYHYNHLSTFDKHCHCIPRYPSTQNTVDRYRIQTVYVPSISQIAELRQTLYKDLNALCCSILETAHSLRPRLHGCAFEKLQSRKRFRNDAFQVKTHQKVRVFKPKRIGVYGDQRTTTNPQLCRTAWYNSMMLCTVVNRTQ